MHPTLLTLLTLFLSLLILSAAADDDAYTACSCVRNRLNKRPCSSFVRHAVPRCAPDASRDACEKLCCDSCHIYGDHWPVCRSASLRRLCDKYTDSHLSDTDIIGPKMPKEPKPDKPMKEPKLPKEDDEVMPSGEEVLISSEPYEPYYTPEVFPSPVEGEQMLQPTPPDEPEVTPMYYPDYPDFTPEAEEHVDPPFDATNEGELDLAPAKGRPFAPAACECMSRGTGCDAILAAASGVCQPGVHSTQQGPDCHFACCRICIVNMFATYCDDAPIVQACGL